MKREVNMKIYLSEKTIEMIKRNDCDLGSSVDDMEYELMEKVLCELSRRGEDHKFDLSDDVFDFVISKLDWYANSYSEKGE